jgi:nicotinate phosphoribosyltransferase
LTAVVGTNVFLADLDLYFAKLFDGLRRDPVGWGEKAIAHYEKPRLAPHGKRLVFSESLDLPKALPLYEHFADRIMTGLASAPICPTMPLSNP